MSLIRSIASVASAAAAAMVGMGWTATARAASVPVYGGPTYDATTQTGYMNPGLNVEPGSTAGDGAAVGSVRKYAGGNVGLRAVRWDASGNPATELGTLGTPASGTTNSQASAINSVGTAVGYSEKHSDGAYLGYRAVRWGASTTAATELDDLGTNSSGVTNSKAYAINSTGTAVGFANRYSGGGYIGYRAVRWDASTSAATELGNLGTDSSGSYTLSEAYAVSSAGVAAGFANKYTAGTPRGPRAVRWGASTTTATELGNLGTDASGLTGSSAYDINSAGTAVGAASKYTSGTYRGTRAVRWNASTTTATELGNLGTSSSGTTNILANAINSVGVAVGYADKYTGGTYRGTRAVRWDAASTVAIELGNLGTDPSGVTESRTYSINSAGAAVGHADKYTGGTNLGYRAVLWNLDAVAFELNTLIDPSSGWTLTQAYDISDTNWVSGIGLFDPDGLGPLVAYERAFLLDASGIAVPEPGTFSVLAVGAVMTLLARRRRLSPSPLGN